MRLQLTLLIAATGAAAADPAGEPGARASLHVYADDDHVTVVSPSAAVTAEVSPRLAITADALVDVVTAASVDVVTSASPNQMHEQRVELGLAASYRSWRATWWTLGARGSHEHDYDAIRLRGGARTEVAQRNTTLQLDYVLGLDRATSMMDPGFEGQRTSHELVLGATQLLGRRALVDVVADLTRADGYHASPYRAVAIEVPDSPLPMYLAEATPRVRTSLAVAARLRVSPADRWATSAMYRVYDDSWSVASHTITAEASRTLGASLLGVTLRGYTQSAASFYAPRYSGEPRYRTHDRTLGAMRSLYGAVTLDAPLGGWHATASAGVLRLWFVDAPAQADRNAVLAFSSIARSW